MSDQFQVDIERIGRIAAVPMILEVVCSTTGMGFAAVARVTEGRWIACSVRDRIAFGLQPGGELSVETTICHEIRQAMLPVAIDRVADDPVFACHPTPAMYGFQSYISVPIVLADGRFFGTLCAIDPDPHVVNTATVIGMFKLFADMIADQFDAQERAEQSAARLREEQETAVLREQFIAVLGHDLRSPLASIDAGMNMLRRTPLSDRAVGVVGLVQNSVRRMSNLIDDMLDLARGRLNGGIPIVAEPQQALRVSLHQIVDEARASNPDRRIVSDIDIDTLVHCDSARIGQLLSNLLGNAIAYGAADQPITVRATVGADTFCLTVANGGEPIEPTALDKLFRPFFRGSVKAHQLGLGLGLYIASQIAVAHGGKLSVASTSAETCFSFEMPVTPDRV